MKPQARRLDVVNEGNRLTAGVVLPEHPRASALLLHGIPSLSPPDPEDAGYPGLAERFAAEGYAAAWADLRGVRGSEGYFSIEGWIRDVQAILGALRATDGLGEIPSVLVGSSAGGAVSTEVVRRGAPVDYLALLAAPATWVSYAGDAGEAIQRITQEAGMPVAPEVLDDPQGWANEFGAVQTERSIREVHLPVLVVHGTDDDVVPVDHADRIVRNAPDGRLRMLDGAGHQLRKDDRAIEAVLEWLRARVG